MHKEIGYKVGATNFIWIVTLG